ncbi:MAG TPA: DUF2946 family protein [Xanthobacteraceae bacterium]|jgi:hypothetical protein|nr:DUF2946 family protein [Xanthobacteraceae bacterium]
MGWVRGHKRHGALLALAALALQIVLSFGHVHLDGTGQAGASSHHAVTHNVTVAKAAPQAPAQNPGSDDDYCAICASIYLASTSLVSAPPVPVPVLLQFSRIEHALAAEHGFDTPRLTAFRSRAPPAAA